MRLANQVDNDSAPTDRPIPIVMELATMKGYILCLFLTVLILA